MRRGLHTPTATQNMKNLSEAAQEDFMKTERSYNFSTSKSIKSLLKLVGAGLKRPPEQGAE